MKPKSIGIVGGAGPLAGAWLLERLLSLSGSQYGCYKDADYPEIILLSYPFSEMLSEKPNVKQLQNELATCLNKLRKNGATILAIACNTLHIFLDEEEYLTELVHLPKALVSKLSTEEEIPLILCTSTSAHFGLHKRFFPCVYPNPDIQLKIDKIIDLILKGSDHGVILEELVSIVEAQTAHTIVLGCTELSLFSKDLSSSTKSIVDPLEIVANKILEKSFEKSGDFYVNNK